MASLAAAALDAEEDDQQQKQQRQARRAGGARGKKSQRPQQEQPNENDGEGADEQQSNAQNGEERGSSGSKRTRGNAASAEKAMLLMHTVRNKLSLLDFEQQFPDSEEGRSMNVEEISSIYFVVPASNASVQFQHFLALVAWLIRKTGSSLTIDQFDDPTTSVNNIMLELNKMNFEADFAPMKLRSAYGEPVCKVLDFLCDKALEASGFTFEAPIYPTEQYYEDAVAAEGAEIEMDDVEDETKEDDDDEDVLYADLVQQEQSVDQAEEEENAETNREMLQSTVDPVAWKTEVERVAPRLKIKPSFTGKEWRSHLEQTKKHEEMLEKFVPDTRVSLEKISSDIGDILEKVQSKEKYINSTFQSLVKEYRELQERFNSLTENYQEKSEKVNQLSNELANTQDSIDELSSQMEDRGSSMTDTSPLVKIKAALSKIRSEINSMDIRIGVLGHTLMQAKLKKSNTLGKRNKDETDEENMELSDEEEILNEEQSTN